MALQIHSDHHFCTRLNDHPDTSATHGTYLIVIQVSLAVQLSNSGSKWMPKSGEKYTNVEQIPKQCWLFKYYISFKISDILSSSN